MPQRLTRSDYLLLALSILILVFVGASCAGAEWCRNNYYCGNAATQQYANDCAAHGLTSFFRNIWCWFRFFREDINAFATAILALFTIVLAIATRRQAELTRSAVDTAAHHAKIAERALTDYERPWLFVEGAKITWRDSGNPTVAPDGTWIPAPRIENDWMITLTLRNYGRMPALAEKCIFKIEPIHSLPAEPDYTNAGQLSLPGTIGPNRTGDTTTVGPGPGTKGQLVFYGRVTYREPNGMEHHTGFALDVAPHMPAFSRHAASAYDYYD